MKLICREFFYEAKIKLICREFFYFIEYSVSVQKVLNYVFQNFPTLQEIILTLINVIKECCQSLSYFSNILVQPNGILCSERMVTCSCRLQIQCIFVILKEVHSLPFVYCCPSNFVSILNKVGDRILELQCLYGLKKWRQKICPRKSVIKWD